MSVIIRSTPALHYWQDSLRVIGEGRYRSEIHPSSRIPIPTGEHLQVINNSDVTPDVFTGIALGRQSWVD